MENRHDQRDESKVGRLVGFDFKTWIPAYAGMTAFLLIRFNSLQRPTATKLRPSDVSQVSTSMQPAVTN